MQSILPQLLLLTLSGLIMAHPPAFSDDSSTEPCGVVLETIPAGSALDKAGFRVGDLVLAWDTPQSLAESDSDRRVICSTFDWLWLEGEQAPKGGLRLAVEREGKIQMISVGPGAWRSIVRPRLREEQTAIQLRARSLLESRKFAEAAQLWKHLSEKALVRNLFSIASWAQVQEAQAWHKAKVSDMAFDRFQTAVVTASKDSNLGTQIQTWYALAEFRKSIGHLDAALNAYESADRLLQELANNHKLMHARLLVKMASLAWMKRDLERANELSKESLVLYSQLAPDSLQFAAALNTAGNIRDDIGYSLEAEYFFKSALDLAHKMGDSEHQAANYNNLGAIAINRGDIVKAAYYFEHALSILNTMPEDAHKLAAAYTNLASLYHTLWRFDEAESYFDKSLEVLKRSAEPLMMSTVQLNRGRMALDRDEIAKAEEFCKQSLEIRESLAVDSLLIGPPLDCLSLAYLLRGELHKALEFIQRALKVAQKHAPGSLVHADYLRGHAKISLHQRKFDLADNYTQEARSIYERLAPNSDFLADSLHQLALIRVGTGRDLEALKLFEEATKVLESQINNGYASEVDRGLHRARRGHIYVNYIKQLIVTKKTEEAFQVLERWRAGAFLAMIVERDLVFSDVPPELERERRRIAHEYDRAQQSLAAAGPTEEIKLLQAQLVSTRARHEEIVRAIRSRSPRLDALRYPQSLDFQSAQRTLGSGELLLSFVLYPSDSLLFVVTPQGSIEVVHLEVGEDEIGRDIEALLNLLPEAQHGRHTWRQQALNGLCHRLYQRLLKPVAAQIENASRLVIIPDGPLHSLPWGALLKEATKPSTQPQYLATWKPFDIVLSATVYGEIRRTRPPSHPMLSWSDKTIAAFGDPVYPNYSSQTNPTPLGVGQTRVYELVRNGLRLDKLPGSRREVEAISTLFAGAARVYLGTEATEERAKSLPRDTHIVHFAAHSRINKKSPLDSAVALTIPTTLFEGGENGLLQAWEILERVRINADLVVLSSCDSGLGKEMGGEGLIGLTRAFQYAGARSVMASLWKISDRTTAEFMVRFYRHLKEGLPKDEALRATQMELIRGPIQVTNDKGERVEFDASAPYYWAAFQIYGDWQ